MTKNWISNTNQLKKILENSRIGWITDMDGTVSPIVSKPEDAYPSKNNRQLLSQLQEKITLVAIVSSRAVDDLQPRFGLDNLIYFGNSGLTRWIDGKSSLDPNATTHSHQLDLLKSELTPQLSKGMHIEDKGITLSIHYRHAENPEKVENEFPQLLNKISQKHDLQWAHENQFVYEVFPAIEINKGDAVKTLVNEFNLDAVVYMGDGTSDIEAVKAVHDLRDSGKCHGLSIGVNSDRPTDKLLEIADITAEGVSDIEALLLWVFNHI